MLKPTMDVVLKNKLGWAIKSHIDKQVSQSSGSQYAVNAKLEENVMDHITCKGVGKIPIPAKLADLRRLVEVAAKKSIDSTRPELDYKKDGLLWEIDRSEIVQEDESSKQFLKNTLPELTNKALKLMGLNPASLEVRPVLKHLLVCGTGGSAKFDCAPVNGEFIKLVLQIPVQGGHEGGRVKVEQHDQIQLFNVCEDSEEYFHLTALYSDCCHQLEEVTFGWRLSIIFNLELEAPKVPRFFPQSPNLETFLGVNKVRDVISQWNQLKEGPQFFVLLLDHRYSASGLCFRGLKGRDRLLYQLLQSIDIVDFHLAQMQKYERGTFVVEENERLELMDLECTCCITKNCKCASDQLEESTLDEVLEEEVKIVNFINVNGDVVKSKGIIIDVDSDVIQFDRPLYVKPEKKRIDYSNDFDYDNDDEPDSFLSCWYDQAVLVLWLKSKTLDMALSCNFTTELTRLEANPDMETLGKVIEFCHEQPERVWNESENREDRTKRLLQLCIDLKAQHLGLRLLEAIACEFSSKIENDLLMDYEGIRSKEVAIGIAKLVNLIGWKSCEAIVHQLTVIGRALNQIENFAYLAIALVDLGVVEFGQILFNKVCSFLFSRSYKLMPRLQPSALVACLSMILRMQEFIRFADLSLKSFIELLASLPVAQLFPVVAEIDKPLTEMSKNNSFCMDMQRRLQRLLIDRFIPDDLAASVMIYILQVEDEILIKDFTYHILEHQDTNAVSKIVASADVWNIAVTSSCGKWALHLLVHHRIEHLMRMSMPVFSWCQNFTSTSNASLTKFLRSTSIREEFNGFSTRRAASDWVEENLGRRHQMKNGYSVSVEIKEESKSKFCCVVTKTREYFDQKMKKFLKSREELIAIRDRRNRRLGDNGSKEETVEIGPGPLSTKRICLTWAPY